MSDGIGRAGEIPGKPEVAIAPLDRTPSGKLGVNVSGVRGGDTTNNFSVQIITPSGPSFGRSRRQLTQDFTRMARATQQ